MNPSKTAQPPVAREPKKRFAVQKLEERIAPKGAPWTKRCRPSW
jgi:hypothetical protein